MTEEEHRIASKDILQRYVGKQGALLMALLDIQYSLGYIPETVVDDAGEILNYSKPEIWGVLTFYSDFKLGKKADNFIDVCLDGPCHLDGAENNMKILEEKLLEGEIPTDFEIRRSSCPRLCSQAPVIAVNAEWHGRMTQHNLELLIETLNS
tara:strand:+ start:167 stop:622 length:456 start_codon:yes stop_codon:yes gene_type:complete